MLQRFYLVSTAESVFTEFTSRARAKGKQSKRDLSGPGPLCHSNMNTLAIKSLATVAPRVTVNSPASTLVARRFASSSSSSTDVTPSAEHPSLVPVDVVSGAPGNFATNAPLYREIRQTQLGILILCRGIDHRALCSHFQPFQACNSIR